MKLTIPLNWADDYFDKIDFSQTEEIYGKLSNDVIGGGRPSLTSPVIKKERVKEFVDEAHRRNLKFNYLINATCFDNLETTKKGYKQLHDLFDWLTEIKVDIITVSLPMILEIIKKNYPHFSVSASVQTRIDCAEKAKYWEDLGADKINISYVDVNKNFDEIKKIRKQTKIQLQTIANLMCVNRCANVTLHGNYNAHSSQCNHVSKGFSFDYYFFSCTEKLLSSPVEILKSAFIRPEDIHLYEELGVDNMKLVERTMTTDHLARIVKAYTERSYDGNMMDLIHGLSKYVIYNKHNLTKKVEEFILQSSFINVFKAKKIIDKLNEIRDDETFNQCFDLHIDNKKLDGFLKYFVHGNCIRDCNECDYCDKFAKIAINLLVSEDKHNEKMEELRKLKTQMLNGDLFLV